MRSNQLRRSKTPSKNYKYEQLETVRIIAKIPATGIKFINGVSNSYDSSFPKELKDIVDPKKYIDQMEHINHKLKMYWPCCFAYYCGYLCVPTTLGLSLFIPNICIGEA